MQQNFQTTMFPTAANATPSDQGANWVNPSYITANDGNSATLQYTMGGDRGAIINGTNFNFNLPAVAVVDGISIQFGNTTGSGCYGYVSINTPGATPKYFVNNELEFTFGSSTDLWGLDSISLTDIQNLAMSVDTGDITGGSGSLSINYVTITVYWHIDLAVAPADVPTRFAYKTYSRDGEYLGDLPNVQSHFAVAQDIGTAGSSIKIVCGQFVENETTTQPLVTNAGDPIETESGVELLASSTDMVIANGSSPDIALFKNSNRVKVWMYNYWYPNGKLMFSGQINRVAFEYGSGSEALALTVYSDGLDLDNYIARGYPFAYTNDASQTLQNGYVIVSEGGKLVSWERFGQTFRTGASVSNFGAINLMVQGTADVSIGLYTAPNGTYLGGVTKTVNVSSPTVIQFDLAQLIPVTPNTDYFVAITVGYGQTLRVYRTTTNAYANGSMYYSSYSGGSGGGSWGAVAGDLYFVTKHGSPTTTTTYSNQDPITGMLSGIMADYNARGGLVRQRNFEATGLSLTYTFNMASIYDAQRKTIELAPTGFYSYVDLGTAEMDVAKVSETADYTVVAGRDVNKLNVALSIENIKNYYLFTGGEVSGVNLFRQYQDTESVGLYGIRTATKTDNRVTLVNTANALGNTFIEENSDETQETTVTVLATSMDITLLTPGKTIGFRGFNPFIDGMVLQIVRRELFADRTILTLGRLPVTMSAEIQRINRDLMNEQTVNNPAQPS